MNLSYKEFLSSSCFSIYQESCIRETPQRPDPAGDLAEKWTELEWQALWYSGAFGTTFNTTTGALVEIIQFGFWNREPGPDFVHAAVRVNGEQILGGDIEVGYARCGLGAPRAL